MRKPVHAMAAAWVITFVLMAYPSYRYFATSTGDEDGAGSTAPTGIVLPSSTLNLMPDMYVRGEEATVPPREVSLPEAGSVLDLTLRTLTPRVPGERYDVVIFRGEEVLWQSQNYQGFTSGEEFAFRLLFNVGEVGPGVVKIVITRVDRETGKETVSEGYRILLK